MTDQKHAHDRWLDAHAICRPVADGMVDEIKKLEDTITALQEEGKKDYDGMLEFQQKFIKADLLVRQLEAGYCPNCEAGLWRIKVLENKLAKANEDWQIRNNDTCHAESRVKELEARIKELEEAI